MAKLTKSVVDRAKLPEVREPGDRRKWRWLSDDEVPGFGLKIYGTGRRVFALRYRTLKGRQRMLRLGPYGTLTVHQARDMARKAKVRVLEGEDPQADRRREAAPGHDGKSRVGSPSRFRGGRWRGGGCPSAKR